MSGCAAAIEHRNKVMRSWMGSHASKLIRSWGPPDRVTTDGAGGKIYIWEWYREVSCTCTEKTGTECPIHTRIEPDRVYMFWADPEGILYHWDWDGFL